MLDQQNTIKALESGTVQQALKIIVIQAFVVAAAVTGRVFDIDAIKVALDNGITILTAAGTAWYAWKAIKARINATQAIAKPPTEEKKP